MRNPLKAVADVAAIIVFIYGAIMLPVDVFRSWQNSSTVEVGQVWDGFVYYDGSNEGHSKIVIERVSLFGVVAAKRIGIGDVILLSESYIKKDLDYVGHGIYLKDDIDYEEGSDR